MTRMHRKDALGAGALTFTGMRGEILALEPTNFNGVTDGQRGLDMLRYRD